MDIFLSTIVRLSTCLSKFMHDVKLKLQLRVLLKEDIAFGPGKAELLEGIRRSGSISQAAKSMNMSYRRAWQLVETMNHSFLYPLVETQKGGTHGGGATVTDFGEKILNQFRRMEENARQIVEHDFEEISNFLKK